MKNNISRKLGIYPKKSRMAWIKIDPEFKEKELLIKGYQVMQRWEDNYMKSLATIATYNGGYTLEIGFGMGISCGYILRSKKIKRHTVIECHPQVISNAKRMYAKKIKAGKLRILEGFWEDISPKLTPASFDGILFDSCSLESSVEFFQFFPFFKEAFRLLKNDGIFTYFSDEPKEISKKHKDQLIKAGFKNIDFHICKVHPPKTCEYWKHNTIVTPIIKKQ